MKTALIVSGTLLTLAGLGYLATRYFFCTLLAPLFC